jgi:sterol desaturase/sphingolipid hydroxylase (fatty acid hydroxylase superfamily)
LSATGPGAQDSIAMPILSRFRQMLRSDLESPAIERQFGRGWISGVTALVMALAGFLAVLCLLFPGLFTVPQIRGVYQTAAFHVVLQLWLVVAFVMAVVSLVLRQNKILGLAALFFVVLSTTLGACHVRAGTSGPSPIFFGIDWFVLNVILTGLLFVPLEVLFPRRRGQELFRFEWREDLFYYLVSSMMVQCLTFASLWPALQIVAHTQWSAFRATVAAQPIVLQFVEIMFLTDLVQYWVHRAFHQIPWLWNFHAVHHSAQVMDWMAGARMHFLEIIVLRGTTVIPMYIMGYEQPALQFYIFYVYLHSTFIHANVGWTFARLGKVIVTPRFHHWHHGLEREAIDVNFALHFPAFDRLFGTYHLPKTEWPQGYGISGHPVPQSYWQQFLYPFRRKS